MTNFELSYKGDEEYCYNATGDCVVGDEIKFERAIFTGSYRKPKFAGYELIEGAIISESYGQTTSQHTFTILLKNGDKTRIKGRNLYKNGIWRKPWENEKERDIALNEKHERGDEARAEKRKRMRL